MLYPSDSAYYNSFSYYDYSGVGGYWGEVSQTVEIVTSTNDNVSPVSPNKDDGAPKQCDDKIVRTSPSLASGQSGSRVFDPLPCGQHQYQFIQERVESLQPDSHVTDRPPNSPRTYRCLSLENNKNTEKILVDPGAPTSTMSRKSARLLSRTKSDEDTAPCAKLNRKRKAEEDLDEDSTMIKRTKTYRIETQWIPISENSSISTCTLVPSHHPPTPESEEKKPSELILGSQFRFRNYFISTHRSSPLPKLSWADSREVWQFMLKKESHYIRDSDLFKNHPALQSRMRTILLDWLIEVCEVYRLHRETFYLGVDFVDRYMSLSKGLQKHQLQLIGITSLFIAAKLEEIYPPKIAEFAYVTDGACTEDEILDQELIMLKALNWDLSPLTTNGWLNLYLQVANIEHIVETEHGFVFPQYSSHAFIQIARLVDLCILDIGCLQFPYSVVAASALYHLTTKEIALSVSGFKWADILQCVSWMSPFAITVRESGPAEVKFFPNVAPEDSHHIQTHAIDLNLLEKAQERQEQVLSSLRAGSPDLQAQVITQLTPPHSNKKSGTTTDPLSSPHQDELLENTNDAAQ